MGRLSGKHAIITGAAGGIGQLASRRFCEEGATVLGTDIDEASGQLLAKQLQEGGHKFTFVAADTTTIDGVALIAETAGQALSGRADVLYNNHGMILGKPLLDTSDDDWDTVFDVDLKSVFRLTKAVAPLMTDGGSIINMSSAAALSHIPGMSVYSAAKGGLATFSRAAAVDLAPLGIRVNAICPGIIDTQMPRNFAAGLDDAAGAMLEAHAEQYLVKRFGVVEEVIPLVIYLASDESTFMTGAVIPLDGGYTVM